MRELWECLDGCPRLGLGGLGSAVLIFTGRFFFTGDFSEKGWFFYFLLLPTIEFRLSYPKFWRAVVAVVLPISPAATKAWL